MSEFVDCNWYIEVSEHDVRKWRPADIVRHGCTAAQIALKLAAHRFRHDKISLGDALRFAGHFHLGIKMAQAEAQLDKDAAIFHGALRSEADATDKPEFIDFTADLAPDPPHIARLRQKMEASRQAFLAVMAEAQPIIDAAVAAGGIEYIESQIIA